MIKTLSVRSGQETYSKLIWKEGTVRITRQVKGSAREEDAGRRRQEG